MRREACCAVTFAHAAILLKEVYALGLRVSHAVTGYCRVSAPTSNQPSARVQHVRVWQDASSRRGSLCGIRPKEEFPAGGLSPTAVQRDIHGETAEWNDCGTDCAMNHNNTCVENDAKDSAG